MWFVTWPTLNNMPCLTRQQQVAEAMLVLHGVNFSKVGTKVCYAVCSHSLVFHSHKHTHTGCVRAGQEQCVCVGKTEHILRISLMFGSTLGFSSPNNHYSSQGQYSVFITPMSKGDQARAHHSQKMFWYNELHSGQTLAWFVVLGRCGSQGVTCVSVSLNKTKTKTENSKGCRPFWFTEKLFDQVLPL